MTKISEITDRSAASAWSPIREYADVIAIGIKDSGGAGFDDTGGELEIYDLNLSGGSKSSPEMLGSVKTQSRFVSLAWTPGTLGGKYEMGLLAGGMENGKIHIWDPKAMLEGSDSLVASYSNHASGPVKALQFNTLNPLQLASGGSDGRVWIYSLDKSDGAPTMPSDSGQQMSQITAVAWNTQVAHIVASAAADGTVAVWDIKSRKAWCQLRGETAGQAVADIAWNPTQGLHLLTASADDHNPVIKLWDLRASTTMPLTTLSGHQQGILSMAWCPHDDHLLLSCGKDNRTLLWDLFALKAIAEVPNDNTEIPKETSPAGQDMFAANGLASSQQRRYDVQWSPIKRGVASTCSLDRRVQAHSILGLSSKSGRPPKWMRPASSVAFGFGGTLVSCCATDKIVRVKSVVEQPVLAEVSTAFERTMASTQVIDYCVTRASSAKEPREAQLWAFMQVIFAPNARQQLLDNLGFDPNEIAAMAASYEEAEKDASQQPVQSGFMSKAAEDMVKKALLVGNFEAAVDCCFKSGNLADAMLLASCGGPDLWAKTQTRYFENQSPSRPFLSTVSAIIHNELESLVAKSDPTNWPETLAILSTYGKSDEFPKLCIALGDALEQVGDLQSASLCYMCSLNLEKSIELWRSQLLEANKKNDGLDILALHEFVVKVSIFVSALGPNVSLPPEDAEMFTVYAEKVAEQGLLAVSAKYTKGDSAEAKILRDRLYRSKSSPHCLAAMDNIAPDFPYAFEDIQQSRGPTILRTGIKSHNPSVSEQTPNAAPSPVEQANGPLTSDSDATSLPPGWMAIQDPASGHFYYANQATGEVTWDKPQFSQTAQAINHTNATEVQVAAQPGPAPNSEPQARQQIASTPSRTSKLASKYGDGFVTSSSHPELASQYGNVGTSNPYATSARPGTAQVGTNAPSKAPVSGDLDPGKIPELKPEYQPIKDCLLSLVEALKNIQLTAVDKRLLVEAEKAVAVMLKRLARGEISDEIGQSLVGMCGYINSYDFHSAQSVQTGLVNNDWREHKDWLKGMKSLLRLATTKFAQ